ncbi:glucose dehydrogenase [FAD, quinone] [Amyelois transitella]|uniref:glucose dehydrogenase [FAD, quinone] n=1 Tax=Amyelois transitella TaxID=680683 RepID=UPI00067ACC06|nr:glucose dehydrogenase [FAD, quinone] [Amyelois transitella]
MRWIIGGWMCFCMIQTKALDPSKLFDFGTDLFRQYPRNPNEGFIQDYTPKDQEEFDFIIVGAGSAGCVLANRLTEIADWNVLLIEAGGNENFFTDIPIFAPFLSITPLNWGYKSEPEKRACKDLRGKVCYLPRGKILGGSSVLNFLIYQRGHPDDFNDWVKMGNPGWSYSEVLPYFKKSENIRIPELKNSSYHGRGGYLDIDYAPFKSPLEIPFRKGAEELGYKWNDPNGEQVIGFTKPQATMRKGRRCSSSKAFLEPVRFRRNLKVTKFSTVERILIKSQTKYAYGVEFRKHNKRLQVRARREIIMAAGSIGSAQLLMLSGIGPADHLMDIGVKPILDLPVGYNLQDHVTFSGNAFLVNDSDLTVSDLKAASPASAAAYLAGQGPLTLPGGSAGLAFSRTKYAYDDPSPTRPDVELVMGGGSIAGDLFGSLRATVGITDDWWSHVYYKLSLRARQQSFALNPVLIRPRSVGRLTLRSARFSDHPKIQLNYFEDPRDMGVLIEGVRLAQRVITTKAFQRYGTRLHDTPFRGCEHYTFDSDKYWECAIMQTSITLDHEVGTCKMAPLGDRTGVVSPRLLVHGMQGLRIADASIMPRIPAAHTHAAVVMIAEKAADLIKEDWGMLSKKCTHC